MARMNTASSEPVKTQADSTIPPSAIPPVTNDNGAAKAPPLRMDQTLRLASKLDRILSSMPAWARKWTLAWLNAKYPDGMEQSPAPTSNSGA